jgi:hypothetical protein
LRWNKVNIWQRGRYVSKAILAFIIDVAGGIVYL